MSGRGMVMDSQTALGSSPQPEHIGLGRRLVQKYQGTGRHLVPFLLPGRAGLLQILTLLLAGAECLFLYVRFSAAKT